MNSIHPQSLGPSETVQADNTTSLSLVHQQLKLPVSNILMIPPINTLPFDMFQIIVTTCWEDEGESFAIAASHVCQLWRRYVLGMPLLWNNLEFAGDVPRWEMLEAKLKRSGRAPLDIIIEEKVFLKSGMPHLRRIMGMIIPHVARWRSLQMVEVPHKIRRVLLDQLRGKSALLLERLEIVQGRKYDRPYNCRIKSTSRHWDARQIFDGIPNLRHLEWTNPKAESRLLPPFRNLLTLKIGRGTLDMVPDQFIPLVLRILSVSPALQELSLHHGPDRDFWASQGDVDHLVQPPTAHQSLRRLHIVSTTGVRSAILRSLILPNLRSLGQPGNYEDIDVNILCCSALAQSILLPKLHSISIAGNTDHIYHFNQGFYPHMPSLPVAIMNLPSLVVLIFKSVDFGGDNKWLPDLGNCCPRLKSLQLLDCSGYTVKAIRAIVEVRMQREKVEPLEELFIPSYSYFGAERASGEESAWFSQVLRFNSNQRVRYEVDMYGV
ncbi:hypothetical protein FRC04_009178 [Tulasnella sp. 424]|nr:hypothetical protein FRC04_009178 [Tulasnella sp. 424]KAG8973400.1 hypothetical protein FRC05_008791 [Tulasnella sp. 425]